MAARRVFHLQPCGERQSWQSPGVGGHKCDEFCRYFAGSQLCLFAGEEGSGLAMGCEEEEGGLEGG